MKKDIERQTQLDMMGLVFNDEMEQSIRSMTAMYMTAYDEAIKRTDGDIELSLQTANSIISAMLSSNQGGDSE